MRLLFINTVLLSALMSLSAESFAKPQDHRGSNHASNQGSRHGQSHQRNQGQHRPQHYPRNHDQGYRPPPPVYRHGGGGSRQVNARSYHRGGHLPRAYWGQQYHVNNWRRHPRLYAPPQGYAWYSVDDRYVLAAVATGLISAIILSQ
ncbi:Ni/Co efflux regulator RcnB [Acinetobacter calcoaceticus]|uniref:Ni/Co efflux regulator RcnB n=1 Tax=Acinetobacter calcoaceticus TaxID=471 RepID=A0A4R1XUG5_ACICA|nr:Ni/Co efflux regulator RcnB [Acinetobacter calcoaceticus]